jgi:hypothetical protein
MLLWLALASLTIFTGFSLGVFASSGELATMAFLVVFRLLIRDFFWMVKVALLAMILDLFASTARSY